MFDDATREQEGWFMLVFLTPWILYVLYYLLTKLLNGSYISVNKESIDISHNQLPIEASVRILISNDSHLQLEQRKYKGRSRRRDFEPNIWTNDNRTKCLLRYIEIEAQALSLKREIGNFLNSYCCKT